MTIKGFAAVIAAVFAGALVAIPADAAPQKKRTSTYVTARGNTVQVSRDEDGRTRTRVIIQKRSYLDPGTERFPGENSEHGYAYLPNHHATGVLDNTVFGGNNTTLPNQYTLPGRSNPFLRF